MENFNFLKVYYNDRVVGTLAKTKDNLIAFEYDDLWIKDGFSISPISLPLIKKVFVPKYEPFNGLFGVFNDSLPDGWGRLLVDRLLLKNRVNPNEINPLNRLAIVQNMGMGALSYRPSHNFKFENNKLDLDELALECQKILNSDSCDYNGLDNLFTLGGSSGGARPKVLIKLNNEEVSEEESKEENKEEYWIVKFPSSSDSKDIGKIEYDYSLVAKDCGIKMEKTRLFPSKISKGYFGTKRFDRVDNKKIHMISASGLLETSHRLPNLDYNMLMKLTLTITKNFSDIEQLYRLMCFNVFAHNRDDHSKNFSFLFYDEKKTKEYRLSPAYDLTYSNSIGGEHATTIDGEGKNPTDENILNIAKNIGLKPKKAKDILFEIKEKTKILL